MRSKMRSILFGGAVALLLLSLFASLGRAEDVKKVNLNTATVVELDTLPGIGPVIAERIVQFRRENGPFKRTVELLNVRGIGERKFLKLRDRIEVKSSKEKPESEKKP